MTRHELEQFLNRKPFRPFSVTLKTGEQYRIPASERVALMQNQLVVGVEEESVFKRIPFDAVTGIQDLAAAG